MRNTTSIDSIKVERALITGVLFLISVVLGYYAVVNNNILIGLILPGVALLSWIYGRPEILFLSIVFTDGAALLIPGLSSIGVPQFLQGLMLGWAVLNTAFQKKAHPYSINPAHDIWMFLFLLNLLMIMSVRGAGFAMLGSSTYGGTVYLKLFLLLLFYFAAIRVSLPEKYIKPLLVGLVIATLIPAIVDMLLYFYQERFWFLTKLIDAGSVELAESKDTESAVARLSSFRYIGMALLSVAFVLIQKKWARLFVISLVFVLVALTGFRSLLVQVGILVFICSIFFSKERIKTLAFFGIIAGSGLIALFIITPILPLAMQRTLSFIPFLPVDSSVALGAQGSADFRFDMWRDYCLPAVTKYLLIGRGVASEISEFAWLQASWYGSAEFFYHMHRYHSGPFSLLLDFGLVGTVSFLAFFILTIIDACKTLRNHTYGRDNLLFKYYGFLTISMGYRLFHFIFIFGDVTSSFFSMLMIAIQLRIFKKNFLIEPLQGTLAKASLNENLAVNRSMWPLQESKGC